MRGGGRQAEEDLAAETSSVPAEAEEGLEVPAAGFQERLRAKKRGCNS